MTRKAEKNVQASAALHWFTYFSHVHKSPPNQATDGFDHVALEDIVRVQCNGDERRALDMIERIVRAPLQGGRLGQRHVQYLAWVEAGCPKRFKGSTFDLLEEIHDCVRANVRGAA